MNKIKDLIDELNKASELYYNGKESFLTDKEYDVKLKELKELEQKQKIIYANSPSINVGASVLTGLNKIQIKDKPMLSLDKVHSAEEIVKFSDGYDLIASIKCDGLSVRLIYKDTDLISANTRGTGYEGGDITEHIKQFLNVPLKIAKAGTFIIDGEAIIYDKDFEIVNRNGEFKNSRNTASGSLALLDMSIVKNRRLSFIAWDIIEGGNEQCYHYRLEEAEDLGFTVVPALALDCTKIEEIEVNEINKILLKDAKEKGIPCDGIVWRINDIVAGDKKGQTSHHFLNAVAWKPAIEEYETKLLDIELSMGRTGVLTPVAIFEPIEIDGAVIERASLHNFSIMKELLIQPWRGQKIWVYRANMIIPQISKADIESKPADEERIFKKDEWIPCPICGKPISIEESDSGVFNAMCQNPQCEGKLVNRIEHFLGKKGLDVKGISKATIGKLIDWGWVNGLTDIFRLEQYKTEWVSKEGFGAASVGKILLSIDAARSGAKMENFLAAIGIPLVGRSIAKEIVKYYSTWGEFREAVGGDWTEFRGFGPEISKSINNFDYTEADDIANHFLTFKSAETLSKAELNASATGVTFCVTGSLKSGNWKNRNELKFYIESIGGKVADSISSKTNYLINNDINSTSAKNNKAKQLGVPIITEEEFIKAFGQK